MNRDRTLLALGSIGLFIAASVWYFGDRPAFEPDYEASFNTEAKREFTKDPFKFPNYQDGEPAIGDEFVLRVGKKQGCGEADTSCKVLLYLHKK